MALARRPGVARLLTVLTVALAELVLATGAADVAAQARMQRASVTLGAPRVLSVSPVSTAQLLDAVRRADPQGRYAMAVTEIPKASDSDPPMLAVDSARLARVASWWPQYGRLSAADFLARLNALLPGNPASPQDAAMMACLRAIGVEPGGRFDMNAFRPEVQRALEDGIKAGHAGA